MVCIRSSEAINWKLFTECGRQIAGDIDFDGTIERELGEFPWMARIVNSKKYFYCPGVIISPTAVLAKADCIFR